MIIAAPANAVLASAPPNSLRFVRCAARVGSSNVEKTSSISTGRGIALDTGMVAPLSKPCRSLPFAISTYFTISAVFFYVGLVPDIAAVEPEKSASATTSGGHSGCARMVTSG